MEAGRKKGLLISAVILQGVALVVAIVMTIIQSSVKKLFYGELSIIQLKTIPYGVLISIITMLIVYVIGAAILMLINNSSVKVLAGVWVGIISIIKVALPFVSSYMYSSQQVFEGIDASISYSVLTNAVEMCTGPLTVIAFGLFCVGCGRLLENNRH